MGDALKKAIESLNKTYGANTITSFNEDAKLDIDAISTGSYRINQALGIGGFPKGRIVEIYGPESSGKTTLALHVIAEAQKLIPDKKCGYIDAEHAIDPGYAKNIGVNVTDWLFAQPSSGEEALEIAEALVKTNEMSVIVIDSVAALIPQAELDGNYGDSKVGLQARLMSQAMRKINGLISKSDCILIFINQLRDKIGVSWGNPETTTGGNALKFYASIRIDIRRIGQLSDGEGADKEVWGNRTKIKIVKNKVAPPFKIVEVDIVFGVGIDKISEIMEICIEYDIIKINGNIVSYKDTKLGVNVASAYNLIRDDVDLQDELIKEVKIKLGLIELTEEQKEELRIAEEIRLWKLFEERIVKIVEKYKLNANIWLNKIKENFNLEHYKILTDYQISREIKQWNIDNEIK
jgi:recombination protein RecA